MLITLIDYYILALKLHYFRKDCLAANEAANNEFYEQIQSQLNGILSSNFECFITEQLLYYSVFKKYAVLLYKFYFDNCLFHWLKKLYNKSCRNFKDLVMFLYVLTKNSLF